MDQKELRNSSDSSKIENSDVIGSEKKKPMPSYEELRENVEIDTLKIGSYFKGKTEYEIVEKTKSDKKNGNNSYLDDKEQHDSDHVLPLLDTYAQGALRRRIVHDQLDRM